MFTVLLLISGCNETKVTVSAEQAEDAPELKCSSEVLLKTQRVELGFCIDNSNLFANLQEYDDLMDTNIFAVGWYAYDSVSKISVNVNFDRIDSIQEVYEFQDRLLKSGYASLFIDSVVSKKIVETNGINNYIEHFIRQGKTGGYNIIFGMAPIDDRYKMNMFVYMPDSVVTSELLGKAKQLFLTRHQTTLDSTGAMTYMNW